MDISCRTIWQHAAGDTNRNYAALCLAWDVIISGPGYAGPWPTCVPALRKDEWKSKKITDLRRFSEEIQDGDIVVLRIGTSHVLGVGEVVGDYLYRPEFGDVDGWDLQHVRRVRWLWKGLDDPKRFETYALKFGDTTQRLSDGVVKEWLGELSIGSGDWNRPLRELPDSDDVDELPIERVSEFLFDRGVASTSINALVAQIGELTRIAKWYWQFGPPSEHETVAYLVAPLLRALGWTPQRMAVEWRSVDLALFERLPREDESLRVVVEAKKMGSSCLSAVSQASQYADGREQCNRLIVTDGIRYGVFERSKGGAFTPHAYLNLAQLRLNYPILECAGAPAALWAMAPEWRSELELGTRRGAETEESAAVGVG